MSSIWLPAPGDLAPPDSLTLPKARALAAAASDSGLPYVSLVECRRVGNTGDEGVVIEVEVELGQRRVHDVHRNERLAVLFDQADSDYPEVLALREDFPAVPHLNLRPQAKPRSLCLYETPYDEVKLHWTASGFVETIRAWLARTAKGHLHAADQPLEPLLLGGNRTLILPLDVLKTDATFLGIRQIYGGEHGLVFTAEGRDPAGARNAAYPVALVVHGKPQTHGIIQQSPRSVHDLAAFLQTAHVDLLALLRDKLIDWYTKSPEILRSRLIIIAVLPKTRGAGGQDESFDLWAFDSQVLIQEIGRDLGIWAAEPSTGGVGLLMVPESGKDGQGTELGILNPIPALTPDFAATVNGTAPVHERLACIGVGALGSQVVANLIRSGWGRWTLIDHDQLLPHNLARHVLYGADVGSPKASALGLRLNSLFAGETCVTGIDANILEPGASKHALDEALVGASVILDMSASLAVARHISRDLTATARRVSLFLNPTGSSLIMLAEDAKRTVALDVLEMQYYRFLAQTPGWENHMRQPEEPVRYARSCRDVSSRMSQDVVALYAAVGSRNLKRVIQSESSEITIWQADPEFMSMRAYTVPTAVPAACKTGSWTVVTDEVFLDRVRARREERLPNETGGVLVGTVEMSRQIIYVVDMVPSPPDSKEWPTVYIRGCDGLAQAVEQIQQRTGSMLQYVGEWHSHPRGHSCLPSSDDTRAFAWLSQIMAPTGVPALMLIVGEETAFYVEKM